MRKIKALEITKAVAELARRANFFLRRDVLSALRKAYAVEKNERAKKILNFRTTASNIESQETSHKHKNPEHSKVYQTNP